MLTDILSYGGLNIIMVNEVFGIPTLKFMESVKPVFVIFP
ncbi:hypothetical protein SDC9_143520 [bioreactor metagenome]|uniref:Uncharacterized protein n=1 Tax=bioreactor metagenome TaxID=1076179 RepID=A0A645E490_9ZZZZ